MSVANDKRVAYLLIAGICLMLGMGGFLYWSGLEDEEAPPPPSEQRSERNDPPKRRKPEPEPKDASAITIADPRSFPDAPPLSVEPYRAAEGEQPDVLGVVVAPDGRAVPGAICSLYLDVSVIQNQPQEGPLLEEVTTDEQGRFGFDGLNGLDRYVLEVRHLDYAQARVYPIELRQQQTLRQRVEMKVGISVRGFVRDASGTPIEGAVITAYDSAQQAANPESQAERHAKSGPDGRYELANLTEGPKRLVARREGYASSGLDHLQITAGKTLPDQDFVLGEGVRLTGVIVNKQTGMGVEGATVMVRPMHGGVRRAPRVPEGVRGASPIGPTGMAPRRATMLHEQGTSDETGRFEIGGLMRATYHVIVRAEGFQHQLGLRAQVGDGEELRVELVPSARITGRVLDAKTGEPVPAFSVVASPAANLDMLPYQLRKRFESEDGSFTYYDVKPGKTYLYVEAEGYAMGRTEELVVNAGQSQDGIEIRLDEGSTILGRVLDARGDPVAFANVSARAQRDTGVDPAAQLFIRMITSHMRGAAKTAITDAKGRYRIPGLRAGTYEVGCEHSNYAPAKPTQVTCSGGAGEEVMAPDFTLTQGGAIEGIVMKLDGSGPETNAQVMVRPESSDPLAGVKARSVSTDSSGAFSVKGLEPGRYRLMVSMRNGQMRFEIFLQQQGTLVTVVEGQTERVKL